MKKYLFLSLIVVSLCSFNSKKDDSIEFLHIGVTNKYIQTVLIVKQDIKQDWESKLKTYVVVVNKKAFDCLYEYLFNEKGNCSNCNDPSAKFGTFQINVFNDKKEDFCFIVKGRKQSLSFFLKTTEYLRKYCDDKRVVEEIEVLIIHNIECAQPIGSGLEDED
jgi:hypothetical protein